MPRAGELPRRHRIEVAGLRWGDWNPETHRLSISRSRQALAGRSAEFATKTRTSRRCVELDPTTETILEHWRTRQHDDGHGVETVTPTRHSRCTPTNTSSPA